MRLKITSALLMFALLFTSHNAYATGNCDGNGIVDIAEVQSAINMFLGLKQVAPCVDEDGSGTVSIAEVQKTINTFLGLVPANTDPVANAGTDQSVIAGAVVTLDGSLSRGNSLTYSWSFTSRPPGSNATLSSAAAVKPTFTIDVAGTYVLNLVVDDGKVTSAAATVTIKVFNVTATGY